MMRKGLGLVLVLCTVLGFTGCDSPWQKDEESVILPIITVPEKPKLDIPAIIEPTGNESRLINSLFDLAKDDEQLRAAIQEYNKYAKGNNDKTLESVGLKDFKSTK